ncbi:hypothetical protein [Streptomyces bobili]
MPIPGAPSSREIVQRPLDILRPSSPAEHARLRTYLGRDWNRHVAAVQRALTHFPGLRSVSADSEITADLAAVHAYLHADALGQGADAVRAALRSGDPDLLAYLACLTSGLRRLPSYRGAALRVTDVFDEVVRDLLPGEEVVEAVPVGAVPLGKGYPALPRDHYLIWSATGRRTDVLMDSEDSHRQADVLFSPEPSSACCGPPAREPGQQSCSCENFPWLRPSPCPAFSTTPTGRSRIVWLTWQTGPLPAAG